MVVDWPSYNDALVRAKSIPTSIEQIEHTLEILAAEKFIERMRLEPKGHDIAATTNLRAASILSKIQS